MMFTLIGFITADRIPTSESMRAQLAFLAVAVLPLPSGTAACHFLLLAFPMALFLSFNHKKWRGEQVLFPACYFAMSFIPCGPFKLFNRRGLLTSLAYHRLLLLFSIMFMLTPSSTFSATQASLNVDTNLLR